MTTMTIELKDDKKKSFIRDLLAKYDFIEILEEEKKNYLKSRSSNLLSLAGLWKDYDIDITELRKKAWGRHFDID